VRRLSPALAFAVALAGGFAWSVEARAMTMIDGGPVGGQVWTAAGSPYLVRGVNGNLTVAAGAELRIEAGTTVLFSDGYGRVLLTIDGKLTITGTAAAPATLQGETDASEWTGISVANESAIVRITGAVIRNARTGLNISRLADLQIARTTFDSCNRGLSLSTGPFTFDGIIARKSHVGVEALSGSSVTLTNCLVQGNTLAGLQVMSASATAINCTFDQNYDAVSSSPLAGAAGPPADIQNAIVSNSTHAGVQDYGGTAASAVRLSRATFWGNATNAFLGSGPSMTYDGATAPPGTDVTVADPKFVSATDLHLRAGSPCIDSGGATGAPDHDLDGNPRPLGSAVDRGAYELAPGGGGTGGVGGSAGAGGAGGMGGASGAGGGSGAGGTGNGGVSAGRGGGAGEGAGTGGRAGAGGDDRGGAGAGGAGVAGGTGATAGIGGATAGIGGIGGAASATGGGAGSGSGGGGATGGRVPIGDATKDDGCDCDASGGHAPGAAILLLAFALALASRRSRRRIAVAEASRCRARMRGNHHRS
jgi:hypothetical protein